MDNVLGEIAGEMIRDISSVVTCCILAKTEREPFDAQIATGAMARGRLHTWMAVDGL